MKGRKGIYLGYNLDKIKTKFKIFNLIIINKVIF
jgi:hypothetical protein